ncbi:hypothetical protein ACQR3P_28770 [Rhodococcus sp. IEGM1300]
MPIDLSRFAGTSIKMRFVSSHPVNKSHHYRLQYGSIVFMHPTLGELTLCFDSTIAYMIDYDERGRIIASVRLEGLEPSIINEMNTDDEFLNLNPDYLRDAVVSYAHSEVTVDSGGIIPAIIEDALHLDFAEITLVSHGVEVGFFPLKLAQKPFKDEQIRFRQVTS